MSDDQKQLDNIILVAEHFFINPTKNLSLVMESGVTHTGIVQEIHCRANAPSHLGLRKKGDPFNAPLETIQLSEVEEVNLL